MLLRQIWLHRRREKVEHRRRLVEALAALPRGSWGFPARTMVRPPPSMLSADGTVCARDRTAIIAMMTEFWGHKYADLRWSRSEAFRILHATNYEPGYHVEAVTAEEVAQSVGLLAKGKASGASGVVLAMIEHAGVGLFSALAPLYTERMANTMPRESRLFGEEVRVTLIPKRPVPSHVHHYRPIACVEVQCKVYMRLLIQRLQPFDTCRHESIQGFCPGRHGHELSHCLSTLSERAWEWRRALTVVKLDWSGAFDGVLHSAIEQTFRRRGVPCALGAAVLRELSRRCLTFSMSGITAGPVQVHKGLVQGCSASPLLFRWLTEDLLHAASLRWRQANAGFSLEDIWVPALCWAGDCILLCRGLQDADVMCGILHELAVLVGLTPNVAKCQVCTCTPAQGEEGMLVWPPGLRGFADVTAARAITFLGIHHSVCMETEVAWRLKRARCWRSFHAYNHC